jgi:type II secretory pathway component PulC
MKSINFSKIIYNWKNKQDPECANALAEITWKFLVTFSVIFIILVSVYSAWIYLKGNAALEDAAIVGESETLSRETLSEVLDQFEQREQRFEYIKRNPPSIADPSR